MSRLRNTLALGTLTAVVGLYGCSGKEEAPAPAPEPVAPAPVEAPAPPPPPPPPEFVSYTLQAGEHPWELAQEDYLMAFGEGTNQQVRDETNTLLTRSGFPIIGAIDRCPPGMKGLEPVIQERCDKLYDGVAPEKMRETYHAGDVFMRRNPERH